jgi:Thioesterase-like superfamily
MRNAANASTASPSVNTLQDYSLAFVAAAQAMPVSRRPVWSVTMTDTFFIRVRVRGYELDTQGHLNWARYLHYAEHARWECLAAAGIGQDALIASGIGPAVLGLA